MRTNLTFQPPIDDKNVFQSNSSNTFGTGRFGDIRPKNITFQGTDSQQGLFFDPSKVGSSQKKENSTNNVFNQVQFQQNDQFSSGDSEKKKGASNKYFQNQSQYVMQNDPQSEQIICQEHGNQARFVCSTVGCPIGGLCELCLHDCPNKTPIDDFFKVMELKLANSQLDVIQNEKYKVFSQIKDYFNEMKQEMINQIEELEIKFIARIMSDTSFNTEIFYQFVPEMHELNLLDLLKNVSQLSKLIFNDQIRVQELSKIFVSDQSRFQKKLVTQVQQLNDLFSNFIYTCEKKLLNCTVDVSELNFRLLVEPSQFHQNRATQNHVKNLKRVKSLQKQETITDLCLISNSIMASAEANGAITIWKVPYFVEMFKLQHGSECSSLAAINDQQNTSFLLSAGKDGDEYQIYLWNINLRYRVSEVTGHSKQLRKIVPLNTSQIAWCQDDQKIRIWKLSDKELAHEVNVHTAWINDLCKISRTCIASCSRDYQVAVIDFISGNAKFIIKDVTYVNCITSINNELFAFANYNGQVKIYFVEQPILIQQIQVSSNWLDTNSIWFLCSLSSETLAALSANGELSFLALDFKKDNLIKSIQLPKSQAVQPLLYVNHFKILLLPHQGEIEVYQ